MQENCPYGLEGGAEKAVPTPIKTMPKYAQWQMQAIILEKSVEHSKIPLPFDRRDFGMLTKWVDAWKPLMLRQAQHEQLPHDPTDFLGSRQSHIISVRS